MSDEMGFSIAPTIHVPLPYTKTKNKVATVGGFTVDYSAAGADSLPYTPLDRIWLEMVTTIVKQTGETRLELGRVKDVLDWSGRPSTGYYIRSAVRSLERVNGMNVTITDTRESDQRGLFVTTVKPFRIGGEMSLVWAGGRSEKEQTLYLPGMNVFEVTEEFAAYVRRAAVPHNATHYREMDNAKEQDLYQWLVWKMYVLGNGDRKEQFIPWPALAKQFWPTAKQKREEKARFIARVEKIHQTYYPTANMKLRDDGLLLKRSPLVIEPDSPEAGYQV